MYYIVIEGDFSFVPKIKNYILIESFKMKQMKSYKQTGFKFTSDK